MDRRYRFAARYTQTDAALLAVVDGESEALMVSDAKDYLDAPSK